jgi:hypothetical protein
MANRSTHQSSHVRKEDRAPFAVKKAGNKWLAADDEMLFRMAADGATADQVARRLRRPEAGVVTRAKKLNLKLRPKRSLRTSHLRPEAPPDYRGS